MRFSTNPGHPYTMGLLRSMPRVDAESYERLIPIEGSPVDMLNPPEGCPFAPRCAACNSQSLSAEDAALCGDWETNHQCSMLASCTGLLK